MLVNALGWVLRWVIYWFLWLLFQIVDPFLAAIIDAMPAEWVETIYERLEMLLIVIETGNFYVPIAEFAIVLVLYWGFVAVFSVVKLILKLIPTIG
jgi:hypothetical protein